MVLASIHLTARTGYWLLFLLVGVESTGVPVPGETALIAAGVLASHGTLQLEFVILVAAAAAILGDNLGYLVGRRGGRALLTRPGPFRRQRAELLRRSDPFFDRHGPKAVFLGRWVAGLRIAAAVMAGATRMPWRSFLLWNALGGVLWATAVAVVADALGPTAGDVFKAVGIYGTIALVGVVAMVLLVRHQRRTRT